MSSNNAFLSVLTEMVMVHLDITLWTGKVIFDIGDYEFLNSGIQVNLPNREQGTLGNKKLVDPAELKPFTKLKDDINTFLYEKGLKFTGGVIFPASDAGTVRARLQQTEQEFERLVSDFVTNYPTYLGDWARRNPELSYAGAPEASEIGRRFSFKYHLYKLGAVQELGEDESLKILETSIRSTFYVDIVKKAKALYGGMVYSRPYGVPEFAKGIEKFRDKLMGLAFLNPEVKKLVDLFDNDILMNVDDKSNQLRGNAWLKAAAILRMISEMNDLEKFLDGQVTYTDYINIVEGPILKAQKIFNDLKKLDLKGKQVTPALVYKICMGETPMPTGTPLAKKKRTRKTTKASTPKVVAPTLPLVETPVVSIPETVTPPPPPKAEPSPMDILNGMFG